MLFFSGWLWYIVVVGVAAALGESGHRASISRWQEFGVHRSLKCQGCIGGFVSSQINDVNVGHQRPIMPFKAISGDEWNLSLTAPTARAVLHINVHLGKLGVGHEE